MSSHPTDAATAARQMNKLATLANANFAPQAQFGVGGATMAPALSLKEAAALADRDPVDPQEIAATFSQFKAFFTICMEDGRQAKPNAAGETQAFVIHPDKLTIFVGELAKTLQVEVVKAAPYARRYVAFMQTLNRHDETGAMNPTAFNTASPEQQSAYKDAIYKQIATAEIRKSTDGDMHEYFDPKPFAELALALI